MFRGRFTVLQLYLNVKTHLYSSAVRVGKLFVGQEAKLRLINTCVTRKKTDFH